MSIHKEIETYINSQPEQKRSDMQAIHQLIIQANPQCTLWFLDGKDDSGKVVSNPNIGYGQLTMKYAGGKTREFYQIGLSGNSAGISVYIMGIEDKTYLAKTYGTTLGKASITGYCIKFKGLRDIDTKVFKKLIQFGLGKR